MSASTYETAARASKASKLVEAIDHAFDLARITLPEARFDSVAGMGAVGWAAAAAVAKVNLPSEATQEIVISCYARRVRANLDAQIAGLLAGALKSAGSR
ncbi:MAG TPA: hypothetical protein VGI97_00470 [Gemmatimonadaceae bacterium]